ncbi:hypothetical protein Tsubulata_030132, partial [Turnera subulata]
MGLFLNGALHWVRGQSASGIPKIIAFDFDKEKFYHVPSPPNQIYPDNNGYCTDNNGFCTDITGVVGDYLCMCFSKVHTEGAKYIVWVMKEYCNEASWIPFISYTF